MNRFAPLFNALKHTPLAQWEQPLREALGKYFLTQQHGHATRWEQLLQSLPDIATAAAHFDRPSITLEPATPIDEKSRHTLLDALETLHPWRKGPWSLFGIDIDTEWRSDLKWDRLTHFIEPLTDRLVLDVGCGNGYHGWRMLAQQPRLVLGADPSALFFTQFRLFKQYLADFPFHFLPLRSEDLPQPMRCFDSVFSMGVLYHRRSPIDHLIELHSLLRPEGELILETLVIDGPTAAAMMPEETYAKMRNVWFIPTVDTLATWLRRSGFEQVRPIDISLTTTEEQRKTPWMRFQSLSDFLDPNDPNLTVEGYPAPRRALILARATHRVSV